MLTNSTSWARGPLCAISLVACTHDRSITPGWVSVHHGRNRAHNLTDQLKEKKRRCRGMKTLRLSTMTREKLLCSNEAWSINCVGHQILNHRRRKHTTYVEAPPVPKWPTKNVCYRRNVRLSYNHARSHSR